MPAYKPISLDDLEDFYALFFRSDTRLCVVAVKDPRPIKITRAEYEASIAKTPPGGWEKLVMEGRQHK